MFRYRVMLTFLLCLVLMPLAAVTADDMEGPPGFDSWDAVLEEARGQTLNWHMWGGSDAWNSFVDIVYGGELMENYGVTLNRVPLADTVDAVNQVLSEEEAGVAHDEGSVDLIWINGENFKTLKQAGLLYGPWTLNVPNSKYLDWEDGGFLLDFGEPIDYSEQPWAAGAFQWIYDTARMDAEDLPRSYAELGEWIAANPGRFTYVAPGPGAFQGTRIVKQLMYELCGGPAPFAAFDQSVWDDCSPQAWEVLNAWEPNLWREGATYPATANELNELFANSEVDFSLTLTGTGAARGIASGQLPETAKAYLFDANMISGFSYLAIPINSANKAAALVMGNLLVRPDMQAAQLDTNSLGTGATPVVDFSTLSEEEAQTFADIAAAIVGAADPAEFAALVPNTASEYHTLTEQDWERCVLRDEC
ncbi:MAG: ABC transporter substrate-binding protein [Chloroflexi bacterium]|nr:ABC transporter substrate-binding protein [Chloroflexota bacterium]